jgi:hypothetical protein
MLTVARVTSDPLELLTADGTHFLRFTVRR